MSTPSKGPAIAPRTLFKPGSWLTKIDFINHLILFNNVLITVLSEKEGGKSSFCTLLQNNLDKQIKPIFLKASAPCDIASILEYVANQLHLNHDAYTTIESIAAQINERKAQVLIIIDDAQHLPESFIKEAMIATKKQAESGFFHLCLVSDYSLVATLNTLSTDSFNNLAHTIDLGALTENEMRTYVLQRAMAANLMTLPLPDAYFKQFYQMTKGNLAKINHNMESFIVNCKPEQRNVKKELLKKRAAMLAVFIVASASSLYLAKSSLSRDKVMAALEQHAANSAQNATTTSALASVVNPEILLSAIPSWLDSSQHQLMEVALPKQQILDDEEVAQNTDTVALVDKVVVIPKVTPGIDLSKAQALAVKGASSSAAKTSKNTNAVAKQTASTLYTIQLVASNEFEDMTRFRKNNRLLVDAKVRFFTNSKGNWYILTIGEYNNRNQAEQQAKQLPAQLAKLNPWVRPVAGLKSIG